MKIVYVDQPSYLPETSVAALQQLGELVVYYDRPSPQEIVERLVGADIAIVEWSPLGRDVLERLKGLRYIVLVTTGYSRVDLSAASELGIGVSNTPGYSRQSVAEHVFALFLMLAKHLSDATKVGANEDATNLDQQVGYELYQSTLGIAGVGSIGSWVAKIGLGFGMKVIGFNRSRIILPDVEEVSLDELVRRSTFLALALPESDETEGIITQAHISTMPTQAIVVSICGTRCFNEVATAEALRSGKIAGLGLDQRPATAELLQAPNVLVTPGSAWYTQASLDRNLAMVVDTVRTCVGGKQRFRVA